MKALEKAPSQRYQSAKEFQAVLESLMASSGAILHSSVTMQENAPPDGSGAITIGGRSMGVKVLGASAIAAILATGLFIGLDVKNLRERIFHPASRESETVAGVPGSHEGSAVGSGAGFQKCVRASRGGLAFHRACRNDDHRTCGR